MSTLAAHLQSVVFDRGNRRLLGPIDLEIGVGDRWLVLGANGSGKSTLLRMLALQEHPSAGTLDVLGGRLGRIDVRTHRRRIGYGAPGVADQLRPDLRALDVVVTALNAALEPWWHTYSHADEERAQAQLDRVEIGHLAGAAFGTLSSGERQRVLLARTLMAGPDLVLLDEPFAGLDLGTRENLVSALGGLAADPALPALVLVTHHLEEVPEGMTHVLALRRGAVVYNGGIEDGLTSATMSATFDLDLIVTRGTDGRFSARLRR